MYKKLMAGFLILISTVSYGCSLKTSVHNNAKACKSKPIGLAAKTLVDSLKNDSEINLEGSVNDSNIHMKLKRDDKVSFPDYDKNADKYGDTIIAVDHSKYSSTGIEKLASFSGTYSYDKVKQDINIIGTLYKGGLFELIEYDKDGNINAYFKGFAYNNKISGGWISAKSSKIYPFKVKEYSFSLTNGKPIRHNTSIQGYYKNVVNGEAEAANLVIFNRDLKGFQFAVDSRHSSNVGINIGSVSGKALFTDASKKKAEYISNDKLLKMTFNIEGSTVIVTANSEIQNYGGIGVNLTGKFTKSED
ncbi:hypothetical protein KYB31_13670 [Clostridium felsineum]|uniref:hypothetical protein n=1 Tax=Clostridium felsineum TaxID=36839 RepID=UPI00214D7230|nr:hypothetical protein [Clostridium felsineum]MCR3760020.1 hypothetical protein [Clostridium felsineum]